MAQTFRDIESEVKHIRHEQLSKYKHIYSISVNLQGTIDGANYVVNSEAVLQIMEDADFHITHLVGKVRDTASDLTPFYSSPVDDYDYGNRYKMAGSPNRSDRGVWFRFIDVARQNRPLQSVCPLNNRAIVEEQNLLPYNHSLVEFNSVFGPGYGFGFGRPVPFAYTLMKGERLKIEFQNRAHSVGEIGTIYQNVCMGFIGYRYESK